MSGWRLVFVTAAVAVVLGCALRFVQLPGRALFVDEAVTQMRVAGHTYAEMNRRLFDGRQRPVGAVLAYARVDARSSVGALIASLEREDAQHPPLFYIADYAAVRALGDSAAAWRLPAALFGLLCIPAAFLLARELFADTGAGLLAAALTAVSPVARVYSEQAREYSLFALLVLLSTYAVVRAARDPRPHRWAAYAVLAAAALYADPLAAPVLAGHAVFAGATLRRRPRAAAAFALALAAAVVAYAPWLVQLAAHRGGIEQENLWTATPWSLRLLAAKWAFNAGAAFFDLEYLDLRWAAALLVVGMAAAYALWRGFRDASPAARWCLGAAIAVPALTLVVPDLVLGQHRSTVARYGMAVWALLPVLAAWGVRRRPLPAMVLLTGGLLACVIGATHAAWWDNDADADDAAIAAAIARGHGAQVVATIAPPDFIPFARSLPSDVRVSLTPRPATAQFTTTGDLFVLEPSVGDLAALRRRTGWRFAEAPYPHVRTAHEMAGIVAGRGAADAAPALLYAALRNPVSDPKVARR